VRNGRLFHRAVATLGDGDVAKHPWRRYDDAMAAILRRTPVRPFATAAQPRKLTRC